MPVVEVHVFGQHVEGGEEAFSAKACAMCAVPQCAQLVACAVECECDQVQGEQGVRQPVLAVAEVVLDVVALVLEQVERLILTLPAGPPAGDDLGDVVAVGSDRGDEAEGAAPAFGADIADAQFHIPDLQRVFVRGQRQLVVGPAEAVFPVRLFRSRGFLDHGPVRPVDAIEVAEQRLVVVGLDAADEVAPGGEKLSAHRFLGIDVIAQVDRTEVCVAPGIVLHPTVGGLDLTVLLCVAVLRRDELRSQRHRVGMARSDHHRRQHAVIIFGELILLAAVPHPMLAPVAADLARVVELTAVQCDQGVAAERLERLQRPIFPQLLQCQVETAVDVGAVDSVELLSDVVVGGQSSDAEKGAAGAPAL